MSTTREFSKDEILDLLDGAKQVAVSLARQG
jgi:hypothetical protein